MTTPHDDRFADLITALSKDPAATRPAWANDQDWQTATDLALLEAELRAGATAAPPLHQDKTAAMLGLVPDPAVRLDPQRLKKARVRAGLDIAKLAAALAALGWQIQTRDVFAWETKAATDVPPALIEAVARVLETPMQTLASAAPQAQESPALDRNDTRVSGLAARLADLLHITTEAAYARLGSMTAAAVHRGDQPRDDELIHRLEMLVEALEQRNGS